MPSSLVEAILGTGDKDITGSEFISKPPHKNEIIDHGHGIIQRFDDGVESWVKDGQLHRDNDLPAVIYVDGTRAWYQHGKLHRDDDKPAIVYPDGYKCWWKQGKRYREHNLPNVIRSDGTQAWWYDGRPHNAPREEINNDDQS